MYCLYPVQMRSELVFCYLYAYKSENFMSYVLLVLYFLRKSFSVLGFARCYIHWYVIVNMLREIYPELLNFQFVQEAPRTIYKYWKRTSRIPSDIDKNRNGHISTSKSPENISARKQTGCPSRARTCDQVINSHLLYHWAIGQLI